MSASCFLFSWLWAELTFVIPGETVDDMARRLDQLEAAITAENESNQTT
jgi:preprotein translocase subunit SecY